MRKYKWFLSKIIILTIMILPTMAFADDLVVTYDEAQIGIGDTIEITVTVSGENLSVAQGEFIYDYNVISYIESYGGGSDGKFNMVSASDGGQASLTCVLEFEAIAVGKSTIDIRFNNILNYEGTRHGNMDKSIEIEVLSDGFVDESSKLETDSGYGANFDGVEAGIVYNSDNKLFVSKSVEDLTLPSGFVDVEAKYNGEEIGAAMSVRDDKIVVFYLYDAAGNGGYYVFDENSNSLSPYVKIASEPDDYIILWNNGALDIPSSYTETSIEINGKSVSAFKSDDKTKPSCLVYAISDAGIEGYYSYIEQDNVITQFLGDMKEEVIPVISENEDTESQPAGNNVLLGLCIACFILALAVIILLIKYIRAVKDKEELLAVSRKKIQEYKKMINR